MLEYKPIKIKIESYEFWVNLNYIVVCLDDSRTQYGVTLAFAKFDDPIKIIASKAVKNPNDAYNLYYGKKLALHRLLVAVYSQIVYPKKLTDCSITITKKEFVKSGLEQLLGTHLLRKWK